MTTDSDPVEHDPDPGLTCEVISLKVEAPVRGPGPTCAKFLITLVHLSDSLSNPPEAVARLAAALEALGGLENLQVSGCHRDPATEGLALLRKGFVALYGEKDPQAGLRLTMQTAETTKGTSHVLTGLAVLHTAEAHAMLGQQAECEHALSEADGYFQRVDAADVAFDLFSPLQHGRLADSCYLFLEKAKQAQPILEATAQQLRDRSKSRAIMLGNLSLACIRQGKLDEAAAVLHQAIDVIERTWGGGGLTIVFGACRELQLWRHVAVVQDVYDRAMALMAA